MSVPLESIEAGKCYLTRNDQVVRVMNLLSNGYVVYAFRSSAVAKALGWTGAQTALQVFAHLIEREVPSDWTPARDGQDEHGGGQAETRDPGPTRDATALLSRLILDHTITQFVSNFEAVRRRGVPPEVRIWIREKDDVSCARVAKQVQGELWPLLGRVRVNVEPDPWIPGARDKSRG